MSNSGGSASSAAGKNAPHHSLPPRPPPSSRFPAHLPSKASSATASYSASMPGYGTPPSASAPYTTSSYAPMSGPTAAPGFPAQQHGFYPQSTEQTYGAPQIMNPFPLPGQAGIRKLGYDAETEAQIAQWQTAYATKDDGAAKGSVQAKMKDSSAGGRTGTSTPAGVGIGGGHSSSDSTLLANHDTPQTVIRQGGGKSWEDSKLLEWDPAHFRIFVGNLAGEVTDDSLLKAFSKYPSVQKARVIRDKRTTKSKGFGFVSFSNSDEYFKAAREMQGKYIGSHPVTIRRAMADVRPVVVKDKDKKKGNRGGMKGLHANTGAGVQKNQKDKGGEKGGLKLLG